MVARVNQRLCAILGYSLEELAALDFSAVTHPDDLAADWQNVEALLRGEGETYAMEKRYFRKDGNIVWVNLTVSLVRGEDEQPKYFISVVEDISDRRAAAQAMQRQADMLDQAQEPILVWELRRRNHLLEPAPAEDLYGYSRAEALGQRSHHLLRTVRPRPIHEFEAELARNGSWRGES